VIFVVRLAVASEEAPDPMFPGRVAALTGHGLVRARES
jgi:hypothetical protein